MTELLRVENLCVRHQAGGNLLLDHIKIRLKTNRTLAIVGESGSGKSLLAKAILGLLPPTLQASGDIYWQNQPCCHFKALRGSHIGLIVQNAMTAFDPLMRIGQQCVETLKVHQSISKKEAEANISAYLEQVQLTPPSRFLAAYPNQLSGGQLQRIVLALTLALSPELIIADEPTTALDSRTQQQILPLFEQISRQDKRSLIFITHDIGLAKILADEILVLRQGKIIEHQPTQDLFERPQQPYTSYLLAMREKLDRPLRQLLQGKQNVAAG